MIDSFKKDISVSNQGEVYFELDWKGGGAGEGNAQIWVTPMTYGGIQYHIRREHAAIDGSSDRYGFAHNFDDFMKQTAHIKDWSENYEDRRDDKKLTATVKSEENFRAQINDPRNFYAFEQQIGRPVSFDIGDNGVVQMYLDWGGGPARDINNNAMLNVWVENGKLMYTLNAKGKGMVKGRQVANSMQEMIQNVTQYRMAALGAAPNSPPPVPNAPSAVPVAAPKGAPPPPKVTGSAPSGVPLAPNTGSQMEKPWPKETAEQKEERNRLADGVKKKLLLLTQDDAKLEASGQSVSKLLDESAALLQELKTKYPYDPDIFILGKAYEDLRRDFNENRETDLDQAFEPILQEMRQEIAKAGVKKISMDRLNEVQSPSLLRTVERLRGLNIQPSYVVQSQNPNAKTVVLFMQRHPEQKIANFNQEGGSQDDILRKAFEDSDREFRSLESSQGQIRDAIVAAVRSGLIHTVYEEGLPKGGQLIKLPQVPENELPSFMERMQKEDPEMARDFGAGSLQAQLILGKGLKLTGYDFDELKMKIISGKADMKYRMHAHNAFIASNLSDYVESSPDEVSFLTIGAAHEAFPSSKVAHQLPLSNAMAYYGMNVVVVDTAYSPPVS